MDAFEKWVEDYALMHEREITKADCEAAFRAGMRAAAAEAQVQEPECCNSPVMDRGSGMLDCCGTPTPRPRTAEEIYTAILAEADK